jgi:transposase, IS5 family
VHIAPRHKSNNLSKRAIAARSIKGKCNKPLSEFKKQVNKKRSQVRARVEHVFGHQATAMGGELMCCIGIVSAKAQVGLRNLVYNMHRFMFLCKRNPAIT